VPVLGLILLSVACSVVRHGTVESSGRVLRLEKPITREAYDADLIEISPTVEVTCL
jgi:hypothetical protein